MTAARANRLMVSGIVLTVLGAAGAIWRGAVTGLLATPYPTPVQRCWEDHRLGRYPVLIIFLGLSLVLFGLFRSGRVKIPSVRLPRRTLLAAVIVLGAVLSLREWRYFGSPVWDGYGEFSQRLFRLLVDPGAGSREAFRVFLRGYLHAGSPLTPFLTALLNLGFRDITLSYMVLMFVSTLGTALALGKTLRRFWRVPAPLTLDYLILFFAHCSVMRSLLFPQTDALLMFWTALAVWLGCAYLEEKRDTLLAASSLAVTAAVMTKASGLGLLALFPLLSLLDSFREGRFNVGGFCRAVIFGAVIPAGIFLLYLRGLGVWDNFLAEIAVRGVIDDSGLRYDHNLKLFAVSVLITFQAYLRLIWSRGSLRRRETLPPTALAALTILLLVLGSGTFFLRRFLPLVPALLLLSSVNLERVRRESLTLFNLLILWTIVFNSLVLLLHLYY